MSGLKPRRDPVSGRSVSLLVSQSLCSGAVCGVDQRKHGPGAGDLKSLQTPVKVIPCLSRFGRVFLRSFQYRLMLTSR
jgi:hypothetical protein